MSQLLQKLKLLAYIAVSSVLFCAGYFNSGQLSNPALNESAACDNLLRDFEVGQA